jgi:hypothetical protein
VFEPGNELSEAFIQLHDDEAIKGNGAIAANADRRAAPTDRCADARLADIETSKRQLDAAGGI